MSQRHPTTIHTARDIEEALSTVEGSKAREDYQAVVLDGKTPSQQAADRGVSPSTVNQNVKRAAKKIRRSYEGHERDPLNDVYIDKAVGLYLEPYRWRAILHILHAAADMRLDNAGEVEAKEIRYMARLLSEQLSNRIEEAESEKRRQE